MEPKHENDKWKETKPSVPDVGASRSAEVVTGRTAGLTHQTKNIIHLPSPAYLLAINE